MCGRYALHANPEVVSLLFGLSKVPAYQPRYNIAPASQVLIIRVFGGLIVGLIGGLIAPSAGGLEEQIASAQTQQAINHVLPHTLYREATTSILFPFDQVTAAISGVGSFTPTSIDQLGQATDQRRITSLLSLDQSLLLVWPQIVGLIALTVVCFAVAYILFMRQEVRA